MSTTSDPQPTPAQPARGVPIPAGAQLLAYAHYRDGAWHLAHQDGRQVTVTTRVEALERLIATGRKGRAATLLLLTDPDVAPTS